MAFSYGFFDAKNLDRVYTAEDFTSYLSSLICNGVQDTYGDNFAVTASGGTKLIVGTGKAWINGHYVVNDTRLTYDMSEYIDMSMDRYVIIGISCDVSDDVRMCKLEVLSGTAATEPEIPVFEDTGEKTYLTLAAVLLPGGTSAITANQITDYRDDEDKCGYVKCILGKCRVTEMLSEMERIYGTIDGIRADITGLESGSLSDAVTALQKDVAIADGHLTYIDAVLDAHATRLTTIEHTTIPNLQKQIDTVDAKVTDQIDIAVSQANDYANNVRNDLEDNIITVQAGLQEQIDDLKDKYNTLSGSYTVFGTTINALNSKTTDLEARIETLEANVKILNTTVTALANKVNG